MKDWKDWIDWIWEGVGILVSFAIGVAVAYVILHFVIKFW